MTWKMSMATTPGAAPFGSLLFPGRLEECCNAASDLGYKGVEVNLRARDEVDPVRFGRLLDRSGLTLSMVASGRAFLEDGINFSSPDEDTRRQAVERIKGHIDLAAEFGAPVLIGTIRGVEATDGDLDAAMDLIASCLGECADYAAEQQTALCVEAINRYETVFLHRCEEVLELIDRIDRPNVQVMLDTFHMNIEESSLGEAVRQAGERLGYMHFADSNRQAPGWGHTPFEEIFDALREIEYQGWLCVEMLPVPDDVSAVRQAVDHFQSLEAVAPIVRQNR